MKKQRILSFFLGLALLCGLLYFPPTAQAATASGTCGDNLTWSLENGKLTISGTGDMPSYTYSASDAWGPYREQVTSIVIKNGVTSIGSHAFYSFTSLTSVTIPDSVTSIDSYAFGYCENLSRITIPDSVTSIASYAFYSCTGLTSISIPDSVTIIEYCAFYGCTNLKDVYYGGSAKDWSATSIRFGNTCLTNATIHYNASTLTITGQPATQRVKSGQTVKFTVKASGSGLKYQWQYRTSSTGSWKNSGASTAKKATVKLNATTGKNGYQYRCKVTDSNGKVVYSKAATLYVLGIKTQPGDSKVAAGTTVKFKVKATGDGLKYQWQYRTSSSGTWKNSGASTATKATIKINGTTGKNGYQYRCKITDSAGNVIYSEPATLYVLGIKTQPSSQTVSAGTSVKFTVKATGDGLTYQWQYRTSSFGTWKNSGASTATKATIKINGTTSKNGYQYRCKITDSAGNVIYSNAATLTVK